jgi:hypothetical protein
MTVGVAATVGIGDGCWLAMGGIGVVSTASVVDRVGVDRTGDAGAQAASSTRSKAMKKKDRRDISIMITQP